MSKNILIVESESLLSRNVRTELEDRGFAVQETSDGRGSIELVRRQKPDLVVMEVELSAGQNGYILCGKLKKDDDLKSIPIVIVGNADGFAQHKKLKTRADEYVPKPIDAEALVQMVGNLIGFPESPGASDLVDDEGISLSELVDVEGSSSVLSAEEIAVEQEESQTLTGDAELDMLDAAFDDATDTEAPHSEGVDVEPEISEVDVDSGGAGGGEPFTLSGLGSHKDSSSFRGGQASFVPNRAREPANRPVLSTGSRAGVGSPAPADASEVRLLRARIMELERERVEADERATGAESRASDMEDQLAARTADLEAARAGGGRTDKDVFALREAANKKDKEILRLKSEINGTEREIVEVREKALQLEQQASVSSGELARRDAHLKSLSHKADQQLQDRKRLEQQLANARDEARSATANLDALQSEMDDLRGQLASARDELEEGRNEVERLRAYEEKADSLRRRVVELEEAGQRHEERVARFYAKLKDDEQIREKTRKALAIALQLLDEQQHAQLDIDLDDDETAKA
jgi:DNA-binding response OmpR family regulator